MKLSRQRTKQWAGLALALLSLIVLIALPDSLSRLMSRALANVTKSTHGINEQALGNDQITVRAAGRGNPWINLQDGRDLPTVYTGAAGLEQVLKQDLVTPTALTSADFDEDGVPDLVSGYVGPRGGILTLHRGNLYSIYPNHPQPVAASVVSGQWSVVSNNGQQTTNNGQQTSDQPPPFLPEARVFELPEAPDFLGAGDFDADGHWDVVTAARNRDALYFLPGDGQGGFGVAERIELPGMVTALEVGEINRRDGLTDVVVGIVGPDGPQALVFEWPEGALQNVAQASSPAVIPSEAQIGRSAPHYESFPLPAEATALALEQLDESYEMDLAVAAGSELLIIHGRDRRLSLDEIRRAEVPPATIDQYSFPFAITSIAIGDFMPEKRYRPEVALLSEAGTIHLLGERKTVGGGHRAAPDQTGVNASAGWPQWATPTDSPREGDAVSPRLAEWPSEILVAGSWSQATHLISANVSSWPTDDLVVVDPASHQLHILTTGNGQRTNDQEPMTKDTVSLDPASAPVAALPMRLNRDALMDLVILRESSGAPTVALTAPLAMVTVNSTTDVADGDTSSIANLMAAPGPDGVISLREAITAANNTAGMDTIAFNIPGMGPHTIQPASALPTITDPVVIDGYTQPGAAPNTNPDGFNGTLMIELNGASISQSQRRIRAAGLGISAGSSNVRGLVINRFSRRSGIELVPCLINFDSSRQALSGPQWWNFPHYTAHELMRRGTSDERRQLYRRQLHGH